MTPKKNTYILVRYRDYRNLSSTLLKKSKANYNHYFGINWNNIKNTWKGLAQIPLS